MFYLWKTVRRKRRREKDDLGQMQLFFLEIVHLIYMCGNLLL